MPKGTPALASSVEVQVFEVRVDLSNDMTWRQMIAVGVRRVVLARAVSGTAPVLPQSTINVLPQSTTSDFARRA